MPSTHDATWLNYTFPTATLNAGVSANPYTPFSAFTVNYATTIDKLSWYRSDTTHTAPSRLAIWRADNQTEVVFTTNITDDHAVGWQDTTLPSPVALYPGIRYKLCMYTGVSGCDPGNTVGSTPSSGAGFAWSFVITGYRATGAYGYPDHDDQSGYIRGLDVHNEGSTPPPATLAATTADLDSRFTSWLSETSTDHPDNRLVAVEGKVDTLQTEVGTPTDATTAPSVFGKLNKIDAAGSGVNGFAAIKAVADAVNSAVSGLPGTIASAVTSIINNAADNLTTMQTNMASAFSAMSGDITTMYTDLLATIRGTSGGATGATTGRSPFPGTGWTMSDETDFDTTLTWAVPADLYVFSVSSTRPGLAPTSFAGLPWYPRLGTWCEINGSLGTHRQFLEFDGQILERGGRRMAGLALRCQPATLGHVQAWTLA